MRAWPGSCYHFCFNGPGAQSHLWRRLAANACSTFSVQQRIRAACQDWVWPTPAPLYPVTNSVGGDFTLTAHCASRGASHSATNKFHCTTEKNRRFFKNPTFCQHAQLHREAKTVALCIALCNRRRLHCATVGAFSVQEICVEGMMFSCSFAERRPN